MLLLGYFDGNMKNWNTLKNQWWNVLRTCFLKYLSFKKMVLTSTSTYFVKPISSRHTFLFMYFLFHLDTKTSLSFFFLQLTYEIWNLFWHIHSHCIKVAWRKSYQLYIIPSNKVSQKDNNNKHPFTLTLFKLHCQCIVLFKNKIQNGGVVMHHICISWHYAKIKQ